MATLPNLGPKIGILKSLEIKLLEINGISDEFVLDQLHIGIQNTPILTGKIPFIWYNALDKNTTALSFPMTINPNAIINCFFQFSIEFDYFHYDKIIENSKWLKTIIFEINYQTVRGNKVENNKLTYAIKMDSLADKIFEEKEKYKSEQ